MKKLHYDPIRDSMGAMLGSAPVWCRRSIGPGETLQELITIGQVEANFLTLARRVVSCTSSPRVSQPRGFKGEIALYKGGAPALIDVMSGQAHVGARRSSLRAQRATRQGEARSRSADRSARRAAGRADRAKRDCGLRGVDIGGGPRRQDT